MGCKTVYAALFYSSYCHLFPQLRTIVTELVGAKLYTLPCFILVIVIFSLSFVQCYLIADMKLVDTYSG